MNNKKTSIEQKIINSKFDIVKKALYFLVAPILILLVGVILVSTVGFNQGIDFSGGQTFKVYVNNEAKLENVASYDLNKNDDYNDVYKKITIVLEKNNVNLVSYQKTNVNLTEYDVYNGQAVKVTYQTNSSSSEESKIRENLIEAFGYENFDGAVSSIDEVPAQSSFGWMIGIIASVVFGLVCAIIYLAVRFSKSAIFVAFIQTVLDIFLTLGLMIVFRAVVNLTVGAVVLTAFIISLLNSFVFYNKVKESRKTGTYEGVENNSVANDVSKKLLWKKVLVYSTLIVATLLVVIIAPNAVKSVALGIMIALITTFYSSTFLLPSFWALVDKPSKKKQKV